MSRIVVSAPAGARFTSIPESGFLTDGDDILRWNLPADGWVSGGDGNDLLTLDYSGQAVRVEFDAWLGYLTTQTGAGQYQGTLSFQDFERFLVIGSDGEDTFAAGYEGAATLRGGGGDDLFILRGAGSFVAGGTGDDTVYGATLADTLAGGAGNDLLEIDLSDATAGVDLGRGFNAANWSGFERFAGTLTAFDDTLRGGMLLSDADGGAGQDRLYLDYSRLGAQRPGASLYLFGQENWLNIQIRGADSQLLDSIYVQNFEQLDIVGSAFGDVLQGLSGANRIVGGAGDDILYAGGGPDTLLGGVGNDDLSGSIGTASIMHGGVGNDTIHAYRPDDTIAGGVGHDRLNLDLWYHTTGVAIDLVAGQPGWSGIEAVGGELTRHDDQFRMRVVAANLSGGAGTDLLAFDYRSTGATAVRFESGRLSVEGAGAGGFWLSDFERYDLRGSSGDDRLVGGGLNDTLNGAGGNDFLRGEDGDDLVFGGTGADWIQGDAGDDRLFGGTEADSLQGGTGNDLLDGGSGNDTLSGDNGDDTLRGWDGDDHLSASAGSDLLDGGIGNDSLFAGGGHDLLFGGDGHDMLVGGEGDDTMSGGAGADLFRFNAVPSGNDRIEDFELSRDKLMFWQGSQLADFQIRAGADGARVVWSNGSVLLVGVDAAGLTADHFLF